MKQNEKQNEKQISNVLDRAIMGEEEAFSFLYQENVKKIYNYIFYRTGNIHDAEDLTARVFQRALKHMPNYKKTKVPFSAWLYRIAHNLVANWYRDNSKHKGNYRLRIIHILRVKLIFLRSKLKSGKK